MKAVLFLVGLVATPIFFIAPESEHWRHDPSITGHMISGVFIREGTTIRLESECRPIYQTTKKVIKSEKAGEVIHYHVSCLKV